MQERLEHIPQKDKKAESRSVCRTIFPLIKKGSVICAYFPLKTEPDIRPLILELINRGDNVYLPVFTKNNHIFRRMTDFESLKKGSLHIPEPTEENPELDILKLDIALIPGRAFDKNGGRLGRGNGGYDYWISDLRKSNPEAKIYGVAFECQVIKEIPREEHDEVVDDVITARGKNL